MSSRLGSISISGFKSIRELKDFSPNNLTVLIGYRHQFPGLNNCKNSSDPYRRVDDLEKELEKDINDSRFIPYIQLHEFEALILSDPGQFKCQFQEHDKAIQKLIKLTNTFTSSEQINDGLETAPSKRIIKEISDYDGRKASAGPIIAAKIGLSTLRTKCPHFNDWINKLEQLANPP